jgi:glycosyltransferase involved in cell wall biosynthesis
MIKPRISIIVPCYNQGRFMRETLDCLKQQTIEQWECVIVNDGSTDDTLTIAQEYVAADPRYILVDKPNGGLADARNAGIKASHGKYILPLDSDDLIGETYTKEATEFLDQHPDVTLVYSRVKYFGDRNDEWILPKYSYEGLLLENSIFCSCVYRRSDYDKTCGYNTNMKGGLEDWDFLLSLLNRNSKVYQIPKVLFYYRKHGKTMISEARKQKKELHNKIISNHREIFYPYLHYTIRNGGKEYSAQELKTMERIIKVYMKNEFRNANSLYKSFVALCEFMREKKHSVSLRLDVIGKFFFYGLLRK